MAAVAVALGAAALLAQPVSARFTGPLPELARVSVVPSWPVTYRMNESTIMMPCNNSGFFDPAFSSKFGVADFDWSDGKQLWANTQPMTCEELLLEQAAQVKAFNTSTKVFVYRNLVKALPWYTSVREKLQDPAYSGWFLKFSGNNNYHVPQCDNNFSPPRCTEFYHDQDQTPQHPHGDGSCTEPCDCGEGVPCGEYLWNHANGTMLRTWLINEFVLGPTGLGNANVSGFYLDDGWTNYSAPILPWEPKQGFCDHSPIGGATEEDFHCTADMGLTQADTTAIYTEWAQTMREVQQAIATAGGFAWQSFVTANKPPTDPEQCAQRFRGACSTTAGTYVGALYYQLTWNTTTGALPLLEQDLATFLLTRGPYAWIGYAWLGCSTGSEPPGASGAPYNTTARIFDSDYGQPVDLSGTCAETAPGSRIFTRQWTKAAVSFDCNTYTGKVAPL